MEKLKVVEKFVSINGEGQKVGEISAFIRFKGCNLNCSYCDTKWANEKECAYTQMSCEEILEYILSQKVLNVTLTGGEPLLQENIEKLIEIIMENNIAVEIETNGSINIEKYTKLKYRPSFTLDYKLMGSGMESMMKVENYDFIDSMDTIKFVVSGKEDLDKAYNIINEYKLTNKAKVYLSPVFGRIEPKEIVEYMIDKNMNKVKIQLQLHKFIWDPNKQGV